MASDKERNESNKMAIVRIAKANKSMMQQSTLKAYQSFPCFTR
jgi:hypothetical protein